MSDRMGLSQVDYVRVLDSLPIDRVAQRGLIGKPDWLERMDALERLSFQDGHVFKTPPPLLNSMSHAMHDPNFEDLTGRRFGRLKVIGARADRRSTDKSRGPGWVCLCDCGLYGFFRGPTLKKSSRLCCDVCEKFAYFNSLDDDGKEQFLRSHLGMKFGATIKTNAPGLAKFLKRYGKQKEPNQ